MKTKLRASLFCVIFLFCVCSVAAQSKPWVDVDGYGARAVSTVPQTTTEKNGSTDGCRAKSPIVHLREASTFQNGDGIVLYQCGASNTLSTPLAPTVTPSLVSGPDNNNDVVSAPPGGITAYAYQIVARDKDGGLTAASPPRSTSTGVASLGPLQSSVTTLSRSNNTVTVTTSSANGASVGAIVFVANSTDATFSGFFVISAVISPTRFAYTQGMDTRAGASESATGGTVQVYNCNHLSWAVVKDVKDNPAWQYYIYRNGALAGVSRPGELVWNDYGSTMGALPTLPDFVPSRPPTDLTNDYLATTIVSGAGTTTITLAASAGTTSSEHTVKFDDGPTILAAYRAATSSSRGTVYIPAPPSGSYYINSHTRFDGRPATIFQSGPLVLNETVETNVITWTGILGGVPSGAPQFAFASGQEIDVNGAYPGIAARNGNSFQYLWFSAPAQGLITTVSEGYGFNATFEYDSFTFPSTDYMGQAVVGTAMSNEVFRYVLFSTNDSSGYGYSLTPVLLARNDVPNADPSGEFTCEHCFFVGRGFGFDSKPVVGAGGTFRFENTYAQALRTPLIETGTYNAPLVFVNRFLNDTSITATIANWGGGVTATIIDVQDNSVEAGGPPGIVTGNLMYGLTVENGGDFIGQNRDMFRSRFNKLLSIPVYSSTPSRNTATYSADYFMTAPMHFPSQHTLFWDLPIPTHFNVVPAPGGGLSVGPHTYNVKAVGADNGESAASTTVTCSTTMSDRTCHSTWTPSLGAVSYNVYRDNLGLSCSHVTVAFCSDGSGPCCGPGESQGAGSGLTTIEQDQIITPQLVLSSPLSGAVSSTIAVRASANKVINIPSIGQASADQFSGTSSCSGATKTISLPITYGTQPVILVFDETTKGGANLSAKSTSGFTVSCAGATDVFDWMVIGNPN
jgi:hypothetical protein